MQPPWRVLLRGRYHVPYAYHYSLLQEGGRKFNKSAPCTSKVGPDIDRKEAVRLVTYLIWKRTTKSSCHSGETAVTVGVAITLV